MLSKQKRTAVHEKRSKAYYGHDDNSMSVGLKPLAFCAVLSACVPGSDQEPDTSESAAAESGQASAGDSGTVCLIADRSVLARAPSTAATGPANLRGWISLEHFGVRDSAGAKLVDSDGFALDAAWRKAGADSVVVEGFNDFVRIEMRLRHTTSAARGTLRAHSDAALERDSTGKLREFRRSGSIQFRKASCDRMPAPAGTAAAIDMLPHGTPRPGIRFDPAKLHRGMSVGSLVADSVAASVALTDLSYVGTARFNGEIQLKGWTLRHPDPDLHRVVTCFEADSSSAARLPRWAGDERRTWFCFSNRAEAARALGPPSEGVPATIVVDEFTIYRGLSDEVNSSRLVRLVRRGPPG